MRFVVFLSRCIAKLYCIALHVQAQTNTKSTYCTLLVRFAHFFITMSFSVHSISTLPIYTSVHLCLHVGMCCVQTNKLVIHLAVINSMELFFGFGQMQTF